MTTIKDVARATGLPAKTIRYYEEIGLIHPTRATNGYRHFSEEDEHRLTFLGRARALGFSIAECRDLLNLYNDKSRASADVRAIAAQHLKDIEQKIDALAAMRDTLAHLVDACAGDARPDCPILRDLSG
ncbi:Cu(I)-responsive transcriptional regulator [Pelagivirga sediminicola]|uniref:Cu(I)-responsive transcriptional regulator n=1 Tax=Pelagivirga sediminicola TaxID=2170575 RepID=A0A2T7G6F8_9RHOB|nr:Cu(I)-responsive transcriptional regulator [Pelagivirga sediminicola]PVA10015.1 Cu(I)-responsive transcriptional regulator [Pelagivirga sediminicola]